MDIDLQFSAVLVKLIEHLLNYYSSVNAKYESKLKISR